jgi:hypothetical protein
MRRRNRLKRARELNRFFRDKRYLQKQFYDQTKNENHKEIHLSKSHAYMDLEYRSIELICRMHNNKPMIKDVMIMSVALKKITTNPNFITAFGFTALSGFLYAIMTSQVYVALTILILTAGTIAILKGK